MLERLTKGLDEALQGIRKSASKLTLRAEEQARLARLNLRVKTLTRDLDKVLVRIGRRLYALRRERGDAASFGDGELAAALGEADRLTEQMESLRRDMERVREDYALRLRGTSEAPPAAAAAAGEAPPPQEKQGE